MYEYERYGHITQKPLSLMQTIIEVASNPNAIILDPFLGSGTTAVAALKTGRRFIGIEIDAGFAAQAQRRVDAVLAQTRLDL